jgi:peroxiredoxin
MNAPTPPSAPSAPRRRRRWLLGGVALAALAAGGGVALYRLQPGSADADAVVLLQQLSLPDAEGKAYALAATAGQTVVLNFWATWCPPCIEEMPDLATLHREIAGRNGRVIGIGIDSPDNIREFASKHRFPYPLLVGGMGGTELSRRFGNSSGALPFTVVIAPDRQIAKRILGRVRLDQLRKVVEPLLR